MSEGSLGRNMHIYQIFTSEEAWMVIMQVEVQDVLQEAKVLLKLQHLNWFHF